MFKVGVPYVFSRRKYIKTSSKERFVNSHHGEYTWISKVQGIVFIPTRADEHRIDAYGLLPEWCTELPIRPKRIVKKVKAKSEPKLSLDDLAGSDTLCEHCHCTEYGTDMNAMNVTAFTSGCEGAYCGDAYAHYLDN